MSKKDIKDCTFTGVKYDAEMASAVVAIARGLESNAEALARGLEMNAEAFKELASAVNPANVSIGPMININD